MKNDILFYLLSFNLLSLIILAFIPAHSLKYLRVFSLVSSVFLFIFSLLLYVFFDKKTFFFQYTFLANWFSYFGLYYHLGLDGISLFFVLLTTFLIPLCVLVGWQVIKYRLKLYFFLLLLIEFLLINVFAVLDLFLFYVFFESVLIPMFLLIGIWGSRERKIDAAYKFFLYTLFGSVFMLLAIIFIYVFYGSTNIFVLYNVTIPENLQLILFLPFFLSLAIKLPAFPVHLWLPEAHVEAPTAGSMLLAGILLKMGGYAFLRFVLPIFPFASAFFSPLIYLISVLSILYISLTTIRQIDLKKIIAYSSVAHMSFVTLGIFSETIQGIEASILLMISHGIVSSGLFFCIGLLYDRYKTRTLAYYGGLINFMPLYGSIFFIFTLANMGFPGTGSFVGEFLVLLAIAEKNTFVCILAALGTVFGAVYSIWLYTRIFFGPVNSEFIKYYSDLNKREFYVLLPLLFLIFFQGLFPSFFSEVLHSSSLHLLLIS